MGTHSLALRDLVSRYDLPAAWRGQVTFLDGWVAWSHGRVEVGLADMRKGISVFREQGHLLFTSVCEPSLAAAEASVGQIDPALTRVDDAIAEIELTGQRWYEAEMHCIRGEILLKRDPGETAAAEAAFQTAIAVALHQKARSFELRAALALARLFRAGGRDADAYAVLAPALEGFSPTPEAHRLLAVDHVGRV